MGYTAYCPICKKNVGGVGYLHLTESEFKEARASGKEIKVMHLTDDQYEGDHPVSCTEAVPNLYSRLCPLSKRTWINSRQIIVPILPSSSEESPGWFPELRKPQADRYADCSSAVRKPCSSKNSILFLVPAPDFLPTFASKTITVSSIAACIAHRASPIAE